MNCVRLLDPAILVAGVFSGTRLDPLTGNLSQYGTPALVADIDPNTTSVYALASVPGVSLVGSWTEFGGSNIYPTGVLGGAPLGLTPLGGGQPWQASANHIESTDTPGSYAQWTTSAYAVDIQYVQSTTGGIGHVSLDGQPQLAFSCYAPPTLYRLNLDGRPHTIRVSAPGDAVLASPVFTAPTDSAGTAGLSAAIGQTRNGQNTTMQNWTCYGVASGSAYSMSVYNGAFVYQGSVGAGQTNNAIVPGLTISLQVPGTWNGTSVAVFATLTPTVAISNIVSYPNLAPVAQYTSPVFDSGAPNAAWPFLELVEGPLGAPAPAISFGVGETPVPDASWTWTTVTPVITPDVAFNPWQRVVYGGPTARGRYAQAVGVLTNQQRVWVSDIRLFVWHPETDAFLRWFPAQAYRRWNADGTPMTAYAIIAGLAALAAYEDELADEAQAAVAITTASGAALTTYGLDFGLPRLPGEPDASYRLRLSAILSGRKQGGSEQFLQQIIGGALGANVLVYPAPRTAGGFQFGTTPFGTQPLGKAATGFRCWIVQIPLAQLAIPPESAAQIIGFLRPTGSIPSILYV